MNHHTGGFIDNKNMVVFEYNIEGNVLGNDFLRFGGPERINLEGIARAHFVVGLYGFAIDKHIAIINTLLNFVACARRHSVLNELIDTQGFLSAIDDNIQYQMSLSDIVVGQHFFIVEFLTN